MVINTLGDQDHYSNIEPDWHLKGLHPYLFLKIKSNPEARTVIPLLQFGEDPSRGLAWSRILIELFGMETLTNLNGGGLFKLPKREIAWEARRN